MIVYDGLWRLVKEKSITDCQLCEKCGMDGKTLARLRANKQVKTTTLDKLCAALACQLSDIATYIPDQE